MKEVASPAEACGAAHGSYDPRRDQLTRDNKLAVLDFSNESGLGAWAMRSPW